MSGRLVVCPTPIGNLEDITLRTLAALREADLVACEDTRRTRVLLERYGVQATLLSYHEHNERERTPELVARMVDGAVVALVSDAGMPLVSDPGYVLVAGCIAAGLEVEVLPGPSAAIAALVASGLPAERWRFAGFLPRKRGPLEALLAGADETLVAFESPRRVGASLAVLAELDPERPVAVCRELTKLHEEVVRGRRRGARGALRGRAAARRGGAGHRRGPGAHGLRPGRDRRRPPVDRGRCPPAPGRLDRRRAHRRSRQRSVPSRDERRTRPQRLTPRGPPGAEPAIGSAAMRPRVLLLAALVARRPAHVGDHRVPGRRHRAPHPRPRAHRCGRRRAAGRHGRSPRWVPPVPGAPARLFHLTADPFARGQHRGVDFPARGAVRSACSGRVVFAGRVAGEGTVSVRCGRWRVSYAPLARVAVRAGEPVGPGESLGRTARGIHFGVRREGRRFGYVDPLRFLGTRRAVAAPRRPAAVHGAAGRRPPASPLGRILRLALSRPALHPPPTVAPWPVWLGLLLGLTGLLGAGRLRLPYRRQEGPSCRASSTSSSSPTIQSSR